MAQTPRSIDAFLAGKRIAVAGVSRSGGAAANAILQKLTRAGYEAYAVNPNADEIDGVRCYASVAEIPAELDGVVIGTHPEVAADVVRQCAAKGVPRVWFHRSFGQGSVSDDAVAACDEHGIDGIVGGCPLMFAEPVDIAHRCMRWWLQRRGRVPR